MRILQINNNHYRKGGTDSVYLNLINLLRKKGQYVIPFSFLDKHNLEEEKANYFIPKSLFSNNIGKFYSINAKKNLRKLIQHEKPDIAHIHNIIGGISLSILPILKEFNIPVLVTMHGLKYLCPSYVFINGKGQICEDCKGGKYFNCVINKCAPEGFMKSLALALEAYARDILIPFHKYIDHYHFVSNFFLTKYSEHFPSIKKASSFFPNFLEGLENTKFKAVSNGEYFLFVGRLDREKGIQTLISAFKQTKEVKLKIVGTGALEKFATSNSKDNIEYLGYKQWDELKLIIEKCKFLIIPSECYENNPMTIIEAYSFGKPIIGSNIGGIPEIIKNGETGFLFEAGNVNDLKQKILIANSLDEKTYHHFSENSFKFAHENFTSDLFYNRLINLYEKLI